MSLYGDGTTKFRPSTIASTISWSVLWFSYMMVFLFCIWLDANRGFSSHHNSCNHDAKQKHISFYLVCCTEFTWNSRFCGLLRHFCSFICVRQFEFPFNQKWSEFCVCFFFPANLPYKPQPAITCNQCANAKIAQFALRFR